MRCNLRRYRNLIWENFKRKYTQFSNTLGYFNAKNLKTPKRRFPTENEKKFNEEVSEENVEIFLKENLIPSEAKYKRSLLGILRDSRRSGN